MIRAAVIGVGYLGKFHAEKFARSKRAELVAVVDTDESKASAIAKKLKTTALSDYRKLPEMGVRCASIVCDTSKHYEVASWLMANGIDVLVEKPMTTSTEQAVALIEQAEAEKRILQVGHLERFNPAFQAMKSVLTRPWFFEARRIAPFTGRGADVDVVFDLMIHDIDIISHLVGKPLKRLEAVGIPVLTSSVDIANARLTFEGGAVANVTASRAAFKSERTIRIFQPDLYISLDYGAKKLKMYSKSKERDLLGFPKISTTEHKVEERDALEDEIESFLQCVETRETPFVTGWDGVRALKLVEQIREAFRVSAESLGENIAELGDLEFLQRAEAMHKSSPAA